MEKNRVKVIVHQYPISDRYCQIGSLGEIDSINNKIRVGGAWFEYLPDDKRWVVEYVFEKNETVLWDSNFGYDIVTYMNEPQSYRATCQYLTGKNSGMFGSISKGELLPYTQANYDKLVAKYNIKKTI